MTDYNSVDLDSIKTNLKININENQSTKLYKVWPGFHQFWCIGCLMKGPSADVYQSVYTWGCILGVGVPYMAFVAPILYRDVTPVIPIINYILFFGTVCCLLSTCITDPGIIPRKGVLKLSKTKANKEKYLQEKDPEHAEMSDMMSKYYGSQKNYCNTCNIWRPPRSSHCADCDACVQVMDHHCPFVNNCVGKRNYQFFIGFITSLCFLIISIVIGFIAWAISAADGKKKSQNKDDSLMLILLLGIPFGLIGLVMIGFCFFHMYLMITGKTTREQLKSKNSNKAEANNIMRLEPSLFDPRQTLTPSDQQQLLAYFNNPELDIEP